MGIQTFPGTVHCVELLGHPRRDFRQRLAAATGPTWRRFLQFLRQ